MRPRSVIRSDTGAETPIIKRHNSRSVSRNSAVIRYRSQSAFSSTSHGDSRFRQRSLSPASSLNTCRLNRTENTLLGGPAGFDEQAEFLVDEDKLNCMQIDDIVEILRDMLQKGMF